MNIRFGTIFCLAISVMAFNAHSIDVDHFNLKLRIEEYLAYMMGDDPIRFVRYFYVYVTCRLIKGRFANQSIPLSLPDLWDYLNGRTRQLHWEQATILPCRNQDKKLHGFSLESLLDYCYWIYWWAIASDSLIASNILCAMPGTLLFENYDVYGLFAGMLSEDQRTRQIY
jgi:hypothetical protein